MKLPIVRIEADGKPMTDAATERLLSVRISDEAGLVNDKLELEFDDGEARLQLPPMNQRLSVWLETPGRQSHFMGSFFVDSYTLDGAPRTLSVSASSATVLGNYKSMRTAQWEGQSISAIVKTIAKRHGLEPRVSEAFDNVKPKQAVQIDESDMTLLTRLAEGNGATTKIADQKLLFLLRSELKSASGSELDPWQFTLSDLLRWQMSYSERDGFKSATAVWHEVDSAEERKVTAGSGTPEFRLRYAFASEAEAEVAVEAELKRRARGKSELSLTVPGDARLRAEGWLLLTDVRKEVDGNWAITSVTHSVGNNGYVSTIKAERPNGFVEAAIIT